MSETSCVQTVASLRFRFGCALALCIVGAIPVLLAPRTVSAGGGFQEAPELAGLVSEGKLPPVEKRLPEEPLVTPLDRPGLSIGRYGGTLTQLMGRANDIRRMSAFGYARLVGYDHTYKIVPDLLKSFEVKDEREFTFVLRRGHKWSDGHPFTTEDLRYYFEDVALNPELSPGGPDKPLLVEGRPPVVEVVDKTTIRYRWHKPNPFFLPALASATPMIIYRPAHYLKRFHKRYADPQKLDEQIKKRNRRDWVDLHFNRDRIARLDNPDYPSLDPWVNSTPPPSDRFVFKRNPYYHRVDSEGRQLPYIDQVVVSIVSPKLIPAKVGAGETELQSRGLQFFNYTLLKRGEQRNHYKVRLWRQSRGSQVAIYPNLNAADPVWRALVRDVRFRRALSLAVDRREINQVVYFGLGRESNNTLLPESPLYKESYRTRWADFNIEVANKLLDEIGLTRREGRFRLLPDGRPLEIIMETAGEDVEHSDVLELVRDSWARIGVALFIKPQTREVLRRRVMAGSTVMSVFSGIDNGIATADYPPHEFVPTNDDQLNWPQWGMYYLANGKAGQACDMPEVQQLIDHYNDWIAASTEEQRKAAWHAILELSADQVFSIGIVNAVPQPIVVSDRLSNVPEKAIYSWDPGGHFGMFRPDTFWFADGKEGS
ncbi:MAG TPA: ABC transporter substrate-binding protein [Hyphomicrobiaceae bacterium]|nr:ABC transporter substrate-binding protein [Hyphomicrobiaceae bacterium]